MNMNIKQELSVISEQNILGKEFKVYGDFENPLFLARDVAEWIEIDPSKNTGQMLNNVDKEEKKTLPLEYKGQVREMWFLTEDGLYEVLMLSRKPIAKEFKKQVKQILKDLRKGNTSIVPKTYAEALRELLVQVELNERLQLENTMQTQQIGELKPKADYLDGILMSDSLMTITLIAKDYGMSGKHLNKMLNEMGIQYRSGGQWLLYSTYHDKGYTSSKTYKLDDGRIAMYTQWTQKGRLFLYNLLKEVNVLPTIEKENENGKQ